MSDTIPEPQQMLTVPAEAMLKHQRELMDSAILVKLTEAEVTRLVQGFNDIIETAEVSWRNQGPPL